MTAILVTRPAAQAVVTTAALQQAGYTVLQAPLLTIAPLACAPLAVVPQAVLLTSGNAVSALQASGLAPSTPVFVVGHRTAALVEEAGFSRVNSAAGDAAALAALVIASCQANAGPLLHLAGEDVAGNLSPALAAAGFEVITQVVYRAIAATALPVPVAQAFAAGGISAVLLYSPRTAAVLAGLVSDPRARGRVALCCLSAAVAQAAGTGWRTIQISATPDEASLHKCLASVVQAL